MYSIIYDEILQRVIMKADKVISENLVAVR